MSILNNVLRLCLIKGIFMEDSNPTVNTLLTIPHGVGITRNIRTETSLAHALGDISYFKSERMSVALQADRCTGTDAFMSACLCFNGITQ